MAAVVDGPRWLALCAAGSAAGLVGFALAGPVAAFALCAYAMLATAGFLRIRAGKRDRGRHAALLDRLTGLAADLRAGIPVAAATSDLDPGAARPGRHLVELTAAAVTLSEQTGAPLADLVDRIEADARSTARATASAAAQSAGAQATALLLAALPAGGIGLGYGIGVDPLATLLHTPLGAACTAGAIALQTLGLAWTNRLQPRQP